jgi:hypothetical protein
MTNITPHWIVFIALRILTDWFPLFDLLFLDLLNGKPFKSSLLSLLPEFNFVLIVNMLHLDLNSTHLNYVVLL